jgi:alpha-D-ribose 1-methylphosphonate 5-triphosphate diphosphatase
MHVCVGAPNVIRGQSHDGNLSATEAIEDGSADLLCSDYHPPALLPAVFHLHGRGMPLPEAVRMASLNPANALGLGGTGAIREGYRADLLLIELMEGYPVVRSTLVDGVTVYSSDYYVRREPGRSEPVG